MNEKKRFIGNVIIWSVFSLGSLWFSKEIFGEYFSFGNEIVFSPYSSALPMIPVALSFPCFYWFMAMKYGEKVATVKCKKINRIFIGLIGIFVIAAIVFSFSYTSLLEDKGYQKCSERPDGWMPGMATKYVLPPMSCSS